MAIVDDIKQLSDGLESIDADIVSLTNKVDELTKDIESLNGQRTAVVEFLKEKVGEL